MQQLLGNATNPNSEDTFLQELLLQNLHSHIRMVLASSGDIPLEALATHADKVMVEASPAFFFVNVAPLTSNFGQLRSEVVQLCEMIAALLQVSNSSHRCSHSHPRPPTICYTLT